MHRAFVVRHVSTRSFWRCLTSRHNTTVSALITSSTHNAIASPRHVTLEMVLGGPAHQVSHKCFRNAGVHRVHGHVVAIVRRPAERELRKIAGTHHDTILFVGHIHKNLRPLTSLRILVGNILNLRILADIREVLRHSLPDRNLQRRHTQRRHQVGSIRMRPRRRAETRHRDTDNPFPVPAELVESQNRHYQCQCAVQSAVNADYGSLRMDMSEPCCEANYLDISNFTTPLVAISRIARNERMRIYMPPQTFFEISRNAITRCYSEIPPRIQPVTRAVRCHRVESALFLTQHGKLVNVNVSAYHPCLKRKSLVLRHQASVLINQRRTGVNHILSRFTIAA